MMNCHLVMVDTTQIQPYVFGSNRLRENIGASYLVAQATDAWSKSAVRAATGGRHNLDDQDEIDPSKRIEDPPADLLAEVIYAGGGNFAALFKREEEITAFTQQLSRRTLEEAPGLQLVIASEPFEWEDAGKSFSSALDNVMKKLAAHKRARAVSAPALGLGVTAVCRSTGLPAVEQTRRIGDDEGYFASAAILAKVHSARKHDDEPSAAGQRLNTLVSPRPGFAYPSEFDELGRTRGEQSFIAVVHADGNGMGERVRKIAAMHGGDKRQAITALRDFSKQLNDAGIAALSDTVDALRACVDRGEGEGKGKGITHRNAAGELITRITLEKDKDEDDNLLLPFRPLVFGGDDVAFVCDARLGVSLAVEFLQSFERHTAQLPDGAGGVRHATACAGVAIVKSHYPFARAYELADELCRSAKKFRRDEVNADESCLDWHFALSGLAGSIEAIREREYKVPAGSLTLRPVTLRRIISHEAHGWPVVAAGIKAFQDLLPLSEPDAKLQWANRRNKVKALREALRGGKDSVRHFRERFNRTKENPKRLLPPVEMTRSNWPTDGWEGGLCGYFDAIELADSFIPLAGTLGGDTNEAQTDGIGSATNA